MREKKKKKLNTGDAYNKPNFLKISTNMDLKQYKQLVQQHS